MAQQATRQVEATPHGPAAARSAGRLRLQRKPADLAVNQPGDQYERAADAISCSSIVHDVLQSPGAALDAATRSFMEPRFGLDFSRVRIHTDTKAAESARAVGAHAYTVGHAVVFAHGQYAPGTEAGRRLLAHELAHVIQQQGAVPAETGQPLIIGLRRDPGEQQAHAAVSRAFAPAAARLGRPADAITAARVVSIQRQPNDLSAYPDAERRAIRVSTIPAVLPGDLPDMFTAPQGSTTGNPGTSYSIGGTVVYGASVPATPPILRRGLASVGGWLAGQTNTLPLNSTITLAINLTPYGGTNARYRFTYLAHTERGSTTNVLLIEELGPAAAAPAPVTATAGAFTVRGQNFTLGAGWTDERFALLRQALDLVPDATLTEAAGLTFHQRGRGTPDEAGRYIRDQDAVEMHDNAFPASAARFGNLQSAVRAIVHELGHVLDSRRMERAWRTFDQAGQTPAAQRTLLGARSVSGLRYQAPTQAGGTFDLVEAASAIRDNEFRSAAQQDGAAVAQGGGLSGGVTQYGNTNWEEFFAEAFSIYVTDPRTLEQLRPNVYRYFTRRFPLPAQAGAQGAQGGQGTRP
jgi:hypothetical protein